MIGFICYLVPGTCLLLWTSWRFQRSLRNIVEDFTGSSSFLLLSLGGVFLIALWPLLAMSWLSLKRNEARAYRRQSREAEIAKTFVRGL